MILKTDRSRSLVKKLRWGYLFAGIIVGIVSGTIITIFNNNTTIEAKKTEDNSRIIIDKDTDTPLSIPKNSTRLYEGELKNNLNYHDFVQNNLATRTLNKGDINLWSNRDRAITPIATQKLDNGNYLIALRGTQKSRGGSITFVEVDENGSVQNSYDEIDPGLQGYSRLNGMLEKTTTGTYLSYGFKTPRNAPRAELFFEIDLTKTVDGQLSVTSHPATQLVKEFGTPHEIRFFGKDGDNGDIFIGGFVSDTKPGTLSPFKIPIGTFNIEDRIATYDLSLNNNTPKEIKDYYKEKGVSLTNLSHIIPMDIIKLANGDYFSIINYYDHFVNIDTSLVSTVQIFDANGARKKTILPDEIAKGNSTGYDEGYVIKVEDSFVYYFIKDGAKSYIKQYNFDTQTTKTIRTFPKETYLKIAINEDNSVSFYGYASSLLEDDFKGFYDVAGNFIVFGVMKGINSDESFKIENLTPNPVNKNVLINYVDRVDRDKYFISGSTTATNFGIPTLPSSPNYSPYFMGLYGSVIHKEDFSPAIFASGNVTLNIKDSDLSDQKVLDNWLLTGSKNGTPSDPLAIKVTDTIDLKNPVLGDTVQERQVWLNQRINRNFEQPNRAIDWPALGFDLTRSGPQSVTYFVSDSQKQLTSSSRWVNAITDQTVAEKELYLDATNFSIPLKDVKQSIPTKEKFKELAQTMSWNQVTHEIYEDGKNLTFSDNVTVDQNQLKELQNAKEAKPYPVDVTITIDLDPGGIENNLVTVTNRVWVFVTTKNTTVDPNTSLVIYADDYTLPLQSAKSETLKNLYEHGNVKVYDYYDTNHETVSPLPTIADSHDTEGLSTETLEVITDAQEPSVVTPKIYYTWDKGTSYTLPDVTLYAELLLHTRQVILDDLGELPIPKNGYLRLSYGNNEINITSTSDSEKNDPAYTTSTIDFKHVSAGNLINVDLVIPEYYKYKGYTVSYENISHRSTDLIEQKFKYNLINDPYEIWLTLYIEAKKTGSPNPYSWDYQKNKFGKITIK
ncbi:hypothetical protein RV09_GL001960 [Enterococcus moraviensis]|nr:hypothetical protein RV09_GL001960 [Enterococcus moraviensis]